MNDSIEPIAHTDPIQQLISIAEQIRELDPSPHPELGKYVDISILGYGKPRVRVVFSEEVDFNAKSMEDVRARLEWIPRKARRIAELKAELAKLEAA